MQKILNITACLSPEIESEWVQTVTNLYLAKAIDHCGVISAELIQVIPTEAIQDQGITYTIQLRFEDQRDLTLFREKYEVALERELFCGFGEKMLTFRLVLNSIHKSNK